jgi:uncharacterized membrane protein
MFVALTVLYVDFLCALFIAWNFPLAKRVPILGRYVSWVEGKGAKLMGDHPALRAGAWTGIALYVMLPVRGTGGITAAVIGRGLGMRASHVVSSISVGTFIAALVLSYATFEGVTLLARNLVIGTMVLLFAVCVVLLGYLAMRLSRIRRWESGGPGR